MNRKFAGPLAAVLSFVSVIQGGTRLPEIKGKTAGKTEKAIFRWPDAELLISSEP